MYQGEKDETMQREEGDLLDIGTAIEPLDQRLVPFLDSEARAARIEGQGIYVTVKSLCTMIGIRYDKQYDRIRRTPTLVKHCRLLRMPTKGGMQDQLCIKVTRIGYWLATIQTSSVKKQGIRERIEAIQEDFADAAQEIFLRHIGASPTALQPIPHDENIQVLMEQYNEQVAVTNLMREHLETLVKTLPVTNDKLDQAITLLQQFASIQEQQSEEIQHLDERTDHLTQAHAQTIKEYVARMVRMTKTSPNPLTYGLIYHHLNHYFRVTSYKYAPDAQFEAIMSYLKEELHRAVSEVPEQNQLF